MTKDVRGRYLVIFDVYSFVLNCIVNMGWDFRILSYKVQGFFERSIEICSANVLCQFN